MDEFQYKRKASLLLVDDDEVLDLSNLRFRFQVKSMDVESPNNAAIRVYNLSRDTLVKIRGEFSRVILQAGYDNNFGVIFDGTIKQYRIGREGTTDTYLDILAADGDLAYNLALVNKTLAAGSSSGDRIAAATDAMRSKGVVGVQNQLQTTGGILPRGKVLFGLARAKLRDEVQTLGASWSIQQGVVTIIPKTGYLPNEVVVLSGQTGLIGRPEQTVDGIKARCLINPNIFVGARVQIDNKAINQLVQSNPNNAPVPYNQWTGVQLVANTTTDGIYRVFVIEYDGDTRGQQWYADLVLLAVDPSTDQVIGD